VGSGVLAGLDDEILRDLGYGLADVAQLSTLKIADAEDSTLWLSDNSKKRC
jgi:hypothetical protein